MPEPNVETRANPDGGDGSPIRVLIAELDGSVRRTLRLSLEQGGALVVAATEDGDEAVSLTATLRPDVALVDGRLRDPDCFEVARRIRAQGDAVAVLILDVYEERKEAARAAGAACLLKDTPLATLLNTIHSAARGPNVGPKP